MEQGDDMRPVEAGDERVITHGPDGIKSRNLGRRVRVLLPIRPGEYFGEGRKLSPKMRDNDYWLVASLDGRPLVAKRMNSGTYPAPTACVREVCLGEIE